MFFDLLEQLRFSNLSRKMSVNHDSNFLPLTFFEVSENPVSPSFEISKLLLHLLKIVRMFMFILVDEFSKSILMALSMVVCI